MQAVLFFIYATVISIASIIGLLKFKYLNNALKAIVILLLLTIISELLAYALITLREYGIRYSVYHIYSILQLIFLTTFFIYAIKPYHHRKLLIATIILSPIVGILNIVFLQPFNKLNTNMLVFESFIIITLSLHYIYLLVKNDRVNKIFRHPHFLIALLLLLIWSSTFFFWAFVPVLFANKWPYINLISHIHTIINIIVYSGIGMVLYLYPKNYITHELS